MRIFAERLRKARLNKGIGSVELGKMLNVGNSSVSRWEAGAREPSLDTISRIADILGVNVAYLVGEDDLLFNKLGENEAFSLHDDNIIKIRVFPAETAASFDETTVFDDVEIEEEGTIKYVFVNKNYFTTSSCVNLQDLYSISLWDDSMQGAKMTKGQLAIIKRTSHVESGEVALVCYSGRVFFRWVIVKDDGGVELRPANADFRSEIIAHGNEGSFAVKGVVLGVLNAPYAPQKAF